MSTETVALPLGWALDRDGHKIDESVLRSYATTDLETSIRFMPESHLITFAPTGAGKGVGCVIPALLSYPGSAIVIDPKGENFSVTARYRRDQLHQEIIVLDPYKTVASVNVGDRQIIPASLNPLDLISHWQESIDSSARVLATALVPGGLLSDPFWDMTATDLLAGLISYVMESKKFPTERRNLTTVGELLSDDFDIIAAKALDEETDLSRFTRLSFRNFLNIGSADKTHDSILVTTNTYIQNLFTDAISSSIATTSFDISMVATESRPYTIYLVIPPERLASDRNVLRLWISTLVKIIVSRRSNSRSKVLLLLDECAQLGELPELRQVITLLRGYGLVAWMFFQDLSQLIASYKDWKSILNNCGAFQSFGYDRSLPAREIADILGTISAEEIVDLSSAHQVLSLAGRKPFVARRLNYLTDAVFAKRADQNPYFR